MSNRLKIVNDLLKYMEEYSNKTGNEAAITISKSVLDEIQSDLQRLDAIDNAKPSEALEIVNSYLKVFKEENLDVIYNMELFKKDIETIKQALIKAQEQSLKDKAFELIILKNVDVNEIRPNATAKDYNSKIPYYRQSLTDDEFKFLKEMFHRLDCEKILFELPKKNLNY